jgi:voltage-gated potassium channel Kch
MLSNIAIGAILIFFTTAVHAGGMHLALRSIRLQVTGVESRLHLNRVLRVGRVVLIMYLVAIVEVLIWSAAYLTLGSIEGFEKAIYFSAVTFTTLGYGDVVLDGSRRLLSAIEAVNGIIMFGWSTAIVIAAVQRVYSNRESN